MGYSPELLASKDTIEVCEDNSQYAGWRGFLLGAVLIDNKEAGEAYPGYSVLIYPPACEGQGIEVTFEDHDFYQGYPLNHGQDKGTTWTMEEVLELLFLMD